MLQLRQEKEALQERLAEIAGLLEGAQQELEQLQRVIAADDRLAAMQAEVQRAQELARVAESRLHAKMAEASEMAKEARRWKRKAERLEKMVPKAQDAPAAPAPMLAEEECPPRPYDSLFDGVGA